MSWSSKINAFKKEVSDIQSKLDAIGSQLTQSCKGIGEQQICQALSKVRQELEEAKRDIERMR